ncbi:hypothetical protein SAMN05444401_1724 [Clostridium amylolyticum]|uniref:Uncharacterized protein n=1 Tax=Clostridium amylolyticum TaxID=1121298 RepID=A0A1M6EWW4_9CLOT|nr:hypothetical protein [Clostridium amylolyticum]SHI89893.1 hypothetical protein SAMN05444401_1724 [Clostridium amylolyticum]
MAEFGGFFNSISGDRKYKAEDFANYFKTFITTGVNPAPGSLKVLKKSNNQVEISEGSGCINGYLYLNTTTLSKTVAVGTTRQDRIVLKLDLINRALSIYVKQGVTSGPPALQRDTSVHELSLAKIIVSGSDFSIVDERPDTSICGYMSFTGKADTQEMWNKFNGEWNSLKTLWQDWFTNMQGQSIRGIYIQGTTPTTAKVGDLWI